MTIFYRIKNSLRTKNISDEADHVFDGEGDDADGEDGDWGGVGRPDESQNLRVCKAEKEGDQDSLGSC